MIIALLIILITTVISLYDRKTKGNRGVILSFIIIAIFASLRYGYGSDYFEYLNNFEKLQYLKFGDDLSYLRLERGWNYLGMICRPIGFFGMIILLAIVEYFILCRFIIKYVTAPYHWMAVLCFTLNTNLMLVGLSMMRQFLAMCIILIAVDFIVQNKWIKALITVVFASLFHTSAIICLPICFFGFIDFNKWKQSSAIIFGLVIVVLYFSVAYLFADLANNLMSVDEFSAYGTNYVESGEKTSLLSLPRIYELFLLFCVLFNFKKYNREEAIIAIVFAVGYIFNGFIAFAQMAGRLALYFTTFGIVCVPLVAKYAKDKTLANIFVAIYIVFLTYRLLVFFNEPIWHSFLHYHTIFETNWQ